jgi:pyruvate/2-oxoacid:ferredoxin oxidoreductase beta subunit/Pyruvate/2-oxoacid:ferredoxin oxidoreductase gamma subunit
MNTPILNTPNLPFCKGCGHDLISKNVAKAIEMSGYSPLDIVLVTDIGCHGIIDKAFNTHTVHGLHGRSVALGAGISLSLAGKEKKIIVFIGDGGTTIGLQHIIEASRMNIDMTIIIHNNMLYGMTGGQTSGLTPTGFVTSTASEGNTFAAHDICALTHTAGAAWIARIKGIGDYSEKIAEALATKGCSVVEIVEICPSYGVKLNPGRKLSEIMEGMGHDEGLWTNERSAYHYDNKPHSTDLLKALTPVEKRYESNIHSPFSIVVTGSAGEGVQLAATILSRAALSSGLHVTQKGSYPVTVGVGFSTAEINISPNEINYNGMQEPNAVLATSTDGLAHNLKRINNMKNGYLLLDSSLGIPETGAEIIHHDFRSAGAKYAALYSILKLISGTGILGIDSIRKSVAELGLNEKIPLDKLAELAYG